MILFGPLPDVVIEERKHQEFWRLEFTKQPTEPGAVVRWIVDEPLQIPDGQQRVFVNGVLVVEVANDPAVDRLELREDLTEQPGVVHLREPGIESTPRFQKREQCFAMRFGRNKRLGRKAAGILPNTCQRIVGHGATAVDGRLKEGEPRLGPFGRFACIGEADAVGRSHQVATDRRRRSPEGPAQRPVNGARVPEVVTHEPLDALTRRGARVPEPLGSDFLQLVAQDVVMTSGFQMQHRAHAQEEFLGVFEDARTGASLCEERRVGQLGDGLRTKQVAQRARRFLHIRLELIQRVVELRVTLRNETFEGFERTGVGERKIRCCEELVEQRGVANHRTRVSQCEQEFGVVGVEPGAFGHFAHVVADGEAEIPNRIEKRMQESLIVGTNDARKENQQVDVRVQTEFATPVSAKGKHGHRLCERASVGVELLNQRVHAVRVLPHRMTSAFTSPRRLRQLPTRGLEP